MKKTIILIIFMAAIFSIVSYGMNGQQEQMVDFVYERDAEDVSKIIYDDWNWIFPHEDIKNWEKALSKELWEKNRAGELYIKVLRYNECTVGLVSFHKKNADVGRIRIVSIASAFRGKGYAKKLITAVLNDLFDLGCTSAYLFTHKDNKKVCTYESLGFKKAAKSQDDLAWFESASISADDYPRYVVTKETFGPFK